MNCLRWSATIILFFFERRSSGVEWSELERKGDKKWMGCNFKVAIYNCDSFNKLIKW